MESRNTVRILTIYLDIYHSIQLETPNISSHKTHYRLECGKCRYRVLVYHIHPPLYSRKFDNYHNPQLFIICMVRHNPVAYFSAQIWYIFGGSYIDCPIDSHLTRSNESGLILFVSDMYVLNDLTILTYL